MALSKCQTFFGITPEQALMYPEHLLPKANYHIIQAKHFDENEDLVLIRHIESSKVKYMEGTDILHPDCIKIQKDHLRDLSTNLLGIFTYADIYYSIQKESSEELYALWHEGSSVRKILPTEFFKDEGRQAFFIPVHKTLKFIPYEVQSHKWHFGLFHTPTNCNFWHVSIRVLDENDNEVSQIETITNSGKNRIWKTARDFLVSDIISTKELYYKPIPTDCYQ